MTDEEMVEDYAKLNARQYKHNDGIGFYTSKEEVKQAYLAGLKACRPEWHKVADGDLPKDENKASTLNLFDKEIYQLWRALLYYWGKQGF